MQDFIVLGYIPGTNYETTLSFWLVVYALIFAWLFRWRLLYTLEQLRRGTHLFRIVYTIVRSDLDFVSL